MSNTFYQSHGHLNVPYPSHTLLEHTDSFDIDSSYLPMYGMSSSQPQLLLSTDTGPSYSQDHFLQSPNPATYQPWSQTMPHFPIDQSSRSPSTPTDSETSMDKNINREKQKKADAANRNKENAGMHALMQACLSTSEEILAEAFRDNHADTSKNLKQYDSYKSGHVEMPKELNRLMPYIPKGKPAQTHFAASVVRLTNNRNDEFKAQIENLRNENNALRRQIQSMTHNNNNVHNNTTGSHAQPHPPRHSISLNGTSHRHNYPSSNYRAL